MTPGKEPPVDTQGAEPITAVEVVGEHTDPNRLDPLYTLIASIDREIEQVFGLEPMAEMRREQQAGPSNEELHVVFGLSDSEYAVPMSAVTEIVRPLASSRLPNVPEWIPGVSNLRGEILPVVDLGALFRLQPEGQMREVRMLVVKPPESELVAALLVDRVVEVSTLDIGSISPFEADENSDASNFMLGLYEDGEKKIAVLDPNKLLKQTSEIAQA